MHTNTQKPTSAQVIETYTPRIPSHRWQLIRPTVLTIMMTAHTSNEATTRTRMRALSAYIDWAHHTRGIPLHIDTLLHPDTIDQWIHTITNPGTARSYRYVMRTISPAATRNAPWQPEHAIRRSRLSLPYTPPELAKIHSLADAQPTEYRRNLAHRLITFGLAAGIDGRHHRNLTAGNVIDQGSTIAIRFDHDRCVTVHPRWNDAIRKAVHRLPDNEPLCTPSAINCTLVVINNHHAANPTLHLGRLRSTYIVELLNRQLPLQVILHATGLVTAGRLAEYLRYTTPLTEHALNNALRGATR